MKILIFSGSRFDLLGANYLDNSVEAIEKALETVANC